MSLSSKSFLQPIDRVALTLMLALSVLIGVLLLQGDAVAPKVRDFSWEGRSIGAQDTAFMLNFSRPMEPKSVEDNLQIDPPLPGKISWAGRRMAYTLLAPAAYGNTYRVQLNGAKDRLTNAENSQRVIQPFNGSFRTRDRAFVYLGVQGEEQGRLVLYNLTQQQKTLLTPKDLVVVDFKPYPDGSKVLFSATDRAIDNQRLPSSQLYTVTTGINSNNAPRSRWGFVTQSTASELPGRIDLVLDSKNYQNLKFDLSPDGQSILVQRVNQRNPGEFGLWLVRQNQPPQPLKSQPGGDFLITPDSAAVAVAQGEGIALLPLTTAAEKPLDFLPQYGMILGFSRDGAQAAMVKFNSDYTRSLFVVNNQGVEKQLLRTTGSINSCQFDPQVQNLYCLLTQLLPGEEYQEQPYLTVINLKTGEQKPLVLLPNQREVQMSLSPDGLGLLFDQIVTEANLPNPAINVPRTDDGEAISTSRLWLLPLLPSTPLQATVQPQPEQLPLPGFHPRWLP